MARRSKTQWKELIDEQALSGFSAAEFCRRKSINPKYFSTRKRQFELGKKSFLKVVIPEVKSSSKIKDTKVRIIEFEVFSESLGEFFGHLIR